MLGVCLLFVGIVLINNGMCTLYKVDGKSAAVMNLLTGGLSVFINFVSLVQGNYYAAGTGLLFGFTYLFVAFSKIYKLSPIPFCMVFHLCCSQCTDLWNHRGNYRKCSTWNYRRYPLGRYLVSVGNPLGNCICRRYHGQKARKICTAASGV